MHSAYKTNKTPRIIAMKRGSGSIEEGRLPSAWVHAERLQRKLCVTWVFKGLVGAWQGEVEVRRDYYIRGAGGQQRDRDPTSLGAFPHDWPPFSGDCDTEGGRCIWEGRRPWKINVFIYLAKEF